MNRKLFVVFWFVSALSFLFLEHICTNHSHENYELMLKAAENMIQMTNIIRAHRDSLSEEDINDTGLLGSEFTLMTTTLGDLEAKRTTTNPDFAAVILHMLMKAGVKQGDSVAIGASGSFPALLIATLSACKALDANPIVMCSLGASQWGANMRNFTILDIMYWLSEAGMCSMPVAVSLGGDLDTGVNFPEDLKRSLVEKIRQYNVEFINEPDLAKNVSVRMELYLASVGESGIAAFVNIGGASVNTGISETFLKLKPGLTTVSKFPEEAKQGVLHRMAKMGVPVINLLYMKGICLEYSLPWDPQPLPIPGEAQIYKSLFNKAKVIAVASAHFLSLIVGGLLILKRTRKRKSTIQAEQQ